jgi:GNAT superfamily N-acetyltransferase
MLAAVPEAEAATSGPRIRLARLDEVDAIDELMKLSTRDIFPLFYDEAQTASAVRYISSVDRTLVEDGTYFVAEAADGQLTACGGWSRRDKLYSGSGDAAGDARLLDPATEPARVRAMFTRPDWTRRGLGTQILEACEAAARAEGFSMLALVATLPGLPLYRRSGFVEVENHPVTMPDGVTVDAVAMERPISQADRLSGPTIRPGGRLSR